MVGGRLDSDANSHLPQSYKMPGGSQVRGAEFKRQVSVRKVPNKMKHCCTVRHIILPHLSPRIS